MLDPIAVPPKAAWAALGIGKTKGWELVQRGELKTFKVDGATRVTVASIREFVERQLAA